MKLKNRYAAVCSVMEGKKIEQIGGFSIIMTEGHYGANFKVFYKLND
ncbi:hypothetical protein SAMN06296020_1294 [Anoxynatronum buryatiense]|uniref:Uncharacterized protein n=1 Tax=Anoxynatronum buryatiense TaxID=489973 RepID=A0AA45WZQ2_9CLOT|nr:hypothetical protein SAMN06296020_1294 [Anoxynatronum buryatiense]